MKKLLLTIIMLAIPTLCWAPPLEVCKSSGRKTSDGAIRTTPGYLCGVVIETDGNSDHDATVLVWDIASGTSGTATTDELFKMIVEGGDWRGGAIFAKPIAYSKGMYVDVTGTGAAYTIYYMAQ